MRAKPSKLIAAANDLLERQKKMAPPALPPGFQQAKANPGPTAMQRPEPTARNPMLPGDKPQE